MLLAVGSIFLTAALAPLVVRLLGRHAGWLLSLVPLGAFASLMRHVPRISDGAVLRESFAWMPAVDISLAFYLDGLSLLFGLLVTGIGTLIVIYAGGYLAHNDELGRFYVQLLSFMGAMLGLVLADNVYVFFIFFELTSLTSYLLIGFYRNKEDSRVAARKALVVTGGGGLALLAGLVLLQQATGAMTFSAMLPMGDMVTAHPYYLSIFVLVAIGAFTKSAQFPFHFWLPAAMAGPTPVSAYLHSATMVKAGVFVLARLHPVLGGTAVWTGTLGIIGGFTMVLTAWLALRYTDLKQVLAYTTTMVLGLLTMLLGIGTEKAIVAMVTFTLVHALYKGGLFMMAGSVDHETGTRNVLKLGGLRSIMPFTMAGALLTALSMSGIAPLFGFIGKEVVYEAALHSESGSMLILAAGVLANGALVAAGLIVGLKPFFGDFDSDALPKAHVHEAPVSMWLGPAVLGTLGLAFGVYPALVDHALLQSAHTAIRQQPYELHLALWHGFNAAFMASLVTFALGGTLYWFWEPLRDTAFFHGFSAVFASGPGAVFERGLYGTAHLSHGVTRLFQTGNFRTYLLAIFTTIFVLVGGSLAAEASIQWPQTLGPIRYFELELAGLIVLAAAAAVFVTDRFVAILALSVGGYGVALLYLLFGAPDLAMTQFSIETLSLILLVIVLIHLPGIQGREPLSVRIRDAIVATGCGVLMTVIMMAALAMPMNMELSNYMTENSYTEAFGKNIVNVILVDFRGVDTMGEITVLTIAALGVYVLMRMPRMREEESENDVATPSEPEPSPVKEAA